MTDCTVAGNTSDIIGGGIFVGDGAPTLEMTRCTVRDNHASGNGVGGGIFVGGR